MTDLGAAAIQQMGSLVNVNILGCHSLMAAGKSGVAHLIDPNLGY